MMLEEESNDLGFTSKMTFPISAWMEKEGHIMKSWNRRFFVLDGTTKSVIYYSDSTKNDKKGEIVLNRHAGCSIEPDRPDHKFLMNVAGSKRGSVTTTLLSFESEKSRKTWYDAIMEISQGIEVRVADIIPDSFRLELPMRITYSSNPAKNGVTSPSRRASLNPVAIVSNGNLIPPSVTVSEPSISYSSNDSMFHHEFYTLIMADPDMPSRKNPAMREFIHWMVCNIPGNDVLKGTTVIPYLGPSPVLNSGDHFMLQLSIAKF
jgi:PH domain/Phosphatidylethanolamine-binding protein